MSQGLSKKTIILAPTMVQSSKHSDTMIKAAIENLILRCGNWHLHLEFVA
jgi:hypothetical protein